MRSAIELAGGRTAALDGAFRFGLVCAYRAQLMLCRIRRPRRSGAGVAVWHAGRVLLVRHSYKPGYFLPGGSIGRGETAVAAAARELREEVGLAVDPALLAPLDPATRLRNVFECRLERAPAIRIDNREIVEARFVGPAEARRLGLGPRLSAYLAAAGGTAAR